MADYEVPEFPGPHGQEWISSFKRRLERQWQRQMREQLDQINKNGGVAAIFVRQINAEILNVRSRVLEQVVVPCEALPPECTCYRLKVIDSYDLRVSFEIYLVAELKEMSGPEDTPHLQETLLGSGTWTFGVKDEVRVYRTHDCRGLFDLPRIPENYASVSPDEAFLALTMHRPDAFFVIPGRPVDIALIQFVPNAVKVNFEKGDMKPVIEVGEQRKEVLRYPNLMSESTHLGFMKAMTPRVDEWLTSAARCEQKCLVGPHPEGRGEQRKSFRES